MLKKTFSIFLLLLISFFSFKGWYLLQKGFRLAKVTDPYNLFSTWEKEGSFYQMDPEIGVFYLASNVDNAFLENLFSQPFYFLGKGQQCFAFISEDQKYVLKVYRKDKLQIKPWYYLSFFSPLMRCQKANQIKSFQRAKESLEIVKDKLAEENHVLGIHLGRTKDLHLKANLMDSLGRKKSLDLDSSYFVIQKKVEPLETVLRNTNAKQVEEISHQILQAVLERAKKGVRNKNRRCLANMGLYGGKVVEIDLAEFTERSFDQKTFFKEVRKSTRKYLQYLEKNHPSLALDFERKLEALKGSYPSEEKKI